MRDDPMHTSPEAAAASAAGVTAASGQLGMLPRAAITTGVEMAIGLLIAAAIFFAAAGAIESIEFVYQGF
jgi:acyl dehydratase